MSDKNDESAMGGNVGEAPAQESQKKSDKPKADKPKRISWVSALIGALIGLLFGGVGTYFYMKE